MKYPRVLDEAATLSASMTNCLARFGDGELSLALGGNCISQVQDPKLRKELLEILQNKQVELLVGIPNLDSDTKAAWAKYREPKYIALYGAGAFGSAFITRPDSAPWIDTPAYWAQLTQLWAGKNVVLVAGTERSLRPEQLVGVNDLRRVAAPRRDAYAAIDQILEEIGTPSGPVLMCVGATATVLAARLARKGVHAVDLGHIGMFMRHAGAYAHKLEDLISFPYRREIEQLREKRGWGGDGAKHVDKALAWYDELQPATTLDYGCGEGAFGVAVRKQRPDLRVQEYDPGVKGKGGMPKPCDLIVCTDVLEHVEPDRIDAVLDHIFRITGKGAFFVVATRPANAILPGGRNAHLIVKPAAWWIDKIKAAGFTIVKAETKEGRDVTLWLRK